jgi:NAD(P)-dependent dehydrogenase (short-subunit alcohol dehydrogenase family)
MSNATRSFFSTKVALITGGSRGLGLLLARRICSAGGKVALLARDVAELERAHADLAGRGGEALALQCDLLERTQIQSAVAKTIERFGRIDILINNAGIIEVGPFAHMTREDFARSMMLHFGAPFNLIMETLPHFRRQGGGSIVNIASIGGKVAVPHLAAYCASKFALVGLSDALRAELARENIKVTTVTPGMMRTGSHVNAKFKGDHASEYAWFAASARMPFVSIDAERAADRILNACRRGRASLTMPMAARLLVFGNAIFPNLAASIMKMVNANLPGPVGAAGNALRTGREIAK